MKKHFLVTAGCSFSECYSYGLIPGSQMRQPRGIQTWPVHLDRYMQDHQLLSEAWHLGIGSGTNGIASRRVICQVHKLLQQGITNDRIMVAIMWTGPDRWEFYKQGVRVPDIDGAQENPTLIDFNVERAKSQPIEQHRGWYLTNPHWKYQEAQIYYKYFHDDIGSLILSLEHILRVQWFLQNLKIPFVFMGYTQETFDCFSRRHRELQHLQQMVDRKRWINEDCYNWCRLYSGLAFPRPNDYHPSSEQHALFCEKVIVPWMTSHAMLPNTQQPSQ